MATSSERVPSQSRAAFESRDFRLFQMARLLVIIGTEMLSVAVGWQVYEITKRPLDLGYVGLAQFLPGVLLLLVAGHTADRFDRRKIVLGCYVSFGVCAALLLMYTMRGVHSIAPIYIVMLMIGTVRAFNGPASQALMPQLVRVDHFQNAVAWSSTVFNSATIIGPAIGGVIYGWTKGPVAVYGAAIVAYAIAVSAMVAIENRSVKLEHKEMSFETLLAGFKYVWREKIILGSISLDLFAMLLGGAVALLPVFAKEILKTGPWGLGLLRSAPAIGATAMAVFMAHRPLQKNSGKIMLFCVALFGAFTVVFGLSRSIALSMAALALAGAADMVSVIVRATLVQIATPIEMRGRVGAVNMLFVGASNEFGQFESGITAQWFGTVPAVVLGGIGSMVVVALWAWRFPELRKVDRLTPED